MSNQILIVTKTTSWSLRKDSFHQQLGDRRIDQAEFDRIKFSHDEHEETVRKVCSGLDHEKIDYRTVNVDDETWSIPSSTKVVLTLGGDGTLLSASHRMNDNRDLILFGIRSSGTSVGFLCAGGLEKFGDFLVQYKTCNYATMTAERMIAEVQPSNPTKPKKFTVPALNDILYSHANPAATTRYKISLGERIETHKSSGIWFSTSLGSTAGLLAAGGVIQPKTDRSFQFVVRELYREPGRNFFLVNGFFDAEKKNLTLENRCEKAILAADGSRGVIEIEWGDRVIFRRATPVRIAI